MGFLLITGRRARRGRAARYLRIAPMFLSQSSVESDPSTRNLYTLGMGKFERRGYVDGSGANKPSDGGDHCRFRVCATIDGDGLAVTETCCISNGDNGRPGGGGGPRRGCACRADYHNHPILLVRA